MQARKNSTGSCYLVEPVRPDEVRTRLASIAEGSPHVHRGQHEKGTEAQLILVSCTHMASESTPSNLQCGHGCFLPTHCN